MRQPCSVGLARFEWVAMTEFDFAGIGMTSQRTRDRLVERLREQGIVDTRVLAQIRNLPRHIFVDEALAHRAYEDTALPIGQKQTISQPFIVAFMTELICQIEPATVLEVGTGCGYQTAVLAGLVEKVWTVELLEAMAAKARAHLSALKIKNVRAMVGDGYAGWSVHAPFDAIIVTAAAAEVPDALIEQLAVGGRMVIPVGGSEQQDLLLIEKGPEGIRQTMQESVRFVPLVKAR